MRKLLAVVGLLVVLGLLDFGARWFTQYQVNTGTKAHTTNVGSVSSSLSQFPFVWNLTFGGKVSDATIDLHDVAMGPINVSDLRTQAKDLKLDQGELFGGKARISGAGPINVTAVLTKKNVGDAINATAIVFRDKYVQLNVSGHTVNGQIAISGRTILIKDKRYPTRIPLPSTDLLPCNPTGASVATGGDIVVGCASPTLPAVLVNAIGTSGLKKTSASK